MSIEDEKREYLDNWSKINCNQKVKAISVVYPDCSCENASKSENGHGPISDKENLRFIIVSRVHIDMKRKPNKEIDPSIFDRIFTKGMSTVRIDKADESEQLDTISELYKIHSAISGKYGGVMGFVEFSVESVRYLGSFDYQVCCVLDTPTENKISHADIVSSKADHLSCEKIRIKNELFKNIGGVNAFTPVAQTTDYDLSEYLPTILK